MRGTPGDRRVDAGDPHTAPPRFDPDARRSAAELIRGLDFGQGHDEAAPQAGAPPAQPALAGPAGPSLLREPEAGPASTADARPPAGRVEDRWPDTDILELNQPIEPTDPRVPLGALERFDRFIPADDHENDFGRVERPSRDFEGLESGRRILRALAVVGILAAAAIGGAVFFVSYGDNGGFMERRFGDELQPPTPTVASGEATAPMPTRESAELSVPPVDSGSLPLGATLALQVPQADLTMPVAEMDTPPTPEPPAEPNLAPSPEVAPAITTAPSIAAAGVASTSPAPPMAPAQTATLPPSTRPENIGEAVDWLEREAQRGEADAQIGLATLYAQGTEVEQDYRQAAHWFREAALQDRAEAQFNLGVLHERGLGVQQDPLEALLWYLNAAEKDHAMAQYNLGVAYADGKGVPEDYVEARKWFTKAAERGLSNAQFNLGVLYEEGYGTDRDLVQAYRWYKIAGAYGDAKAGARAQKIGQRLNVEDMARATALIDAFTVMPALSQESPSFSIPAAAPGDFSREVVKEIQTLLTRLNFDPGPADGIPGGRTVDAIREFQRAAGLEVDGQPTVELLAHMRTVMGK
jgi:localization factor PodJL